MANAMIIKSSAAGKMGPAATEVFNDYNKNQAGIKGYYFNKFDLAQDKLSAVFYLSTIQTNFEITEDEDPRDLDFVINYQVGDVISYVSDSKYLDIATIDSIDTTKQTITVKAVNDQTLAKGSYDGGIDDQILYVFNKPEAGIVAFGHYAHAEGENTIAIERSSHAEGRQTVARGQYSHAEGRQTKATYAAHSEGYKTEAMGHYAHAENDRAKATGLGSHAEGQLTQATGDYSHAEGTGAVASGKFSHAEGGATIASGSQSHAEGYQTQSTSNSSHAEGYATKATGYLGSHAEGHSTIASGESSHAEGWGGKSIGAGSHTEGKSCEATGEYSHAEGEGTKAIGKCSHAEGEGTVANGKDQHVRGSFNIEDTEIDENGYGKYIDIVGNAKPYKPKSNAYTLDWDGNGWFAGNVSVGKDKDILITEKAVDVKLAEFIDSAPETLDTLKELANALGNDENFATTVSQELRKKVDKVDGKQLSTEDFTTEHKNKLESLDEIKYEYGTEDIGVGAPLETGKLYFVYAL